MSLDPKILHEPVSPNYLSKLPQTFSKMEYFGEYQGKPGVFYTKNQRIFKEFRNKRLKIEDEVGQLNMGEVYFAAIERLLDRAAMKKFEVVKEADMNTNLTVWKDSSPPFVEGKLIAKKGDEYGVAYKSQRDIAVAFLDYREEVRA